MSLYKNREYISMIDKKKLIKNLIVKRERFICKENFFQENLKKNAYYYFDLTLNIKKNNIIKKFFFSHNNTYGISIFIVIVKFSNLKLFA